MPTTLLLLLCSGGAAAFAALAVIPLAWRPLPPTSWFGWSNALAAGTMMGAAYVLTAAELAAPWQGAVAAVLGILFIRLTHRALRTAGVRLDRIDGIEAADGYRVLLIGSLHSASEGLAIGVAMVLDLRLGLFMAVAIALHNVPEAMILGAVLRRLGLRLGEVAGVVVAANAGQVLFSIVAFALIEAAPPVLPWLQGFAAGALIKLVLVEPLPEAYRETGHTSIAVVASLAMSLVVLFQGFLAA